MPLIIAFLIGSADFAGEMLILRSGRYALGASSQSSTLLIALALAGTAIGAALGGRFAGARSFAFLRAGSGIVSFICIMVPMWAAGAGGWLSAAAAPGSAIAAAFLFALPAGASIPLLYAWTRGKLLRASLLMASQAAGAAAGAWLGGVAAPVTLGMSGGALGILAIDLAAAALAALAPRALRESEPREQIQTIEKVTITARKIGNWAPGALAFAAGASTLALESLFLRLTPFYLGDGSDAAAWLLAAALAGISAGASAAGVLLQFASAARLAGILMSGLVLAGPLALCVLEALARSPSIAFARTSDDYNWARIVFLASLVCLPLSIAGALSPAAFALSSGLPRARAVRVNVWYAVGALAPSLLFPLLLSAGATTPLLIGGVGMFILPASYCIFRLRAAPFLLPIISGMFLGAGDLAARVPPFRGKPWLEVHAAREGPVGLAAYALDRRRHERTLFTNAFRAAATGDDYRYTRSLAHLPILLARAEPSRAAIIAVGTGSTAAAAARHPYLKQIELVEISAQVFELLPWFSPASDGLFVRPAGGASRPAGAPPPQFDPRIKIVIDDGRRFAARSGEKYELIALEPLLPDSPAAYPFYTKEFYALAGRRLAPGGVLAQWIPILATEPRAFRALVGTFTNAFAHRALFLVGKSAILLGSDQPLELNISRIDRGRADAALEADLRRSGCASAGDVAAQCVLGTAGLAAFTTENLLSDALAGIERMGFEPGESRIRYESENIQSMLAAREATISELLPSMEALAEGERAARRAAGTSYLKARRVAAGVESGELGAHELAAALAMLSEATAHPFAALDGARLAARRALSRGLGLLANNDVAKAAAELEFASQQTYDPLAILAYAIALLRGGASDAEAAAWGTLAFALEPRAGELLPAEYPEAGRERWLQDLQQLEPQLKKTLHRIPAPMKNIFDVARRLASEDAAERVAARVAIARERDALGFIIEEIAATVIGRPRDEVASALRVARELRDPTLTSAAARLEAGLK